MAAPHGAAQPRGATQPQTGEHAAGQPHFTGGQPPGRPQVQPHAVPGAPQPHAAAVAPHGAGPHLNEEAQNQLQKKLSELDSTSADFTKNAVDAITSALKHADPNISPETLSTAVKGVIHTGGVVGMLPERAREALLNYVPFEKASQLAGQVAQPAAQGGMMNWVGEKIQVARHRATSFVTDPGVQAVVIPGGASATALAAAGGTAGLVGGALAGAAAGVVPALLAGGLSVPAGAVLGGGACAAIGAVAGAAVGVVPALLTFGLSIPTGGVIGGIGGALLGGTAGGAAGLIPAVLTLGVTAPVGALLGSGTGAAVGATAGGTTGLVGGGAAGHLTYAYRDELKHGATRAKGAVVQTACHAKDSSMHAVDYARHTAAGVASDSRVQKAAATLSSAAAGAVAAGATAGTAGLVMGGAAGGALGLLAAPFTFGLSIPVGAVLGGGGGLALGAVGGGTAGALGGGATGYGLYSQRGAIRSGAGKAWARVSGQAAPSKPPAASATAVAGA